ncbi:MAG: helicase-exonuclease AddAB subunit AddA [Lachnospiraceae bacterium]|nr:helicase-exonuclease AddAB subunit AddA [Lachnospiraceae bacterium]
MNKWTDEQKKVIAIGNSNVLVSAAAGAGKTATLVQRIVDIVKDPANKVNIDELIIVTFTNAAAREMKDRIKSALVSELATSPNYQHIKKQIAYINHAQITTIHSFCGFIHKNYYHRRDIDPDLRIAEDSELELLKKEAMDEYLDEILDEAYGNDDENSEAVMNLMDMLSGWRNFSSVSKVVLELYDKAIENPNPHKWLKDAVKDYDISEEELYGEKSFLNDIFKKACKNLEKCVSMANKATKICEDFDVLTDKYLPDISGEERVFREALDKINALENNKDKYSKFKGIIKQIEFGTLTRVSGAKDDKDLSKAKENVTNLRGAYKDIIKKTKELFADESVYDNLQIVAPYIKTLAHIADGFIDRFKEVKVDNRVMSFGDMEHFALDILTDVDENTGELVPSVTAKELRDIYKGIVVDEYQDSNFVQEAILTAITGADEESPYMFMVGDVKQSIYGFRHAKPELFMHKYDNFKDATGVPLEDLNSYTMDNKNNLIKLNANFRSRSTVIETTNHLFRKIMKKDFGNIDYEGEAELVCKSAFYTPEEDMKNGLDLADYKSELLLLDEKELNVPRSEALIYLTGITIKDLVENKKLKINDKGTVRDIGYSDIAIIIRSVNKIAPKYKAILEEIGIPVFVSEDTGYYNTEEVSILLNLLKILDNPLQDIPLVSVLKSAFFNVTEDELSLIKINSTESFYFYEKVLEYVDNYDDEDEAEEGNENPSVDAENDFDEYVVLCNKLKGFLEVLDKLRSISKTATVYELVNYIYENTDYYDIASAQKDGDRKKLNLDILLDRALEYSENNDHTIFSFVNYIESLSEAEIDVSQGSITDLENGAVNIMSIHKSKGLEYPVVILSEIHKKFNEMDKKGILNVSSDGKVALELYDKDERVTKKWAYKRAIADRIVENNRMEEMRLLYVAMTRAKEKLILVGMDKLEKINVINEVPDAISYLDWIKYGFLMDGMQKVLDVKEFNSASVVEEFENYKEAADEKAKDEASISGVAKASDSESASDGVAASEKTSVRDKTLSKNALTDLIVKQKEYIYPYKDEGKYQDKISVSQLKKNNNEKVQALNEDGFSPEATVILNIDYAGEDDTAKSAATSVATSEATSADKTSATDTGTNTAGGKSNKKSTKEYLPASERGTAYHTVMEHIPYERFEELKADEDKVKEYVESLRGSFLTDAEIDSINVNDIFKFICAPLTAELKKADDMGMLFREEPFMHERSVKELAKIYFGGSDDEPDADTIVQGIIDAFYIMDNKIVIIDYKTDKFKGGNKEGFKAKLDSRYRIQLELYATALSELTGLEVSKKYLYSFSIGEYVEV